MFGNDNTVYSLEIYAKVIYFARVPENGKKIDQNMIKDFKA